VNFDRQGASGEILTGEEGSKAELSDLARMPQPMPPAPADNHIPSPG
jgi:hypothetical protein